MADPKLIEKIFLEVIQLSVDQQEEAIQSCCKGDTNLLKRVSELVGAHNHSDLELFQSLTNEFGVSFDSEEKKELMDGGPETADHQDEFASNLNIDDRFELEQKIGEGGMGEVWVAQQLKPVKRRVAVKLIKSGMDSKAVLLRFDQERQALALMDHPNIARVLDGGATATGQPFFVMELVNGQKLTTFCDQQRLSLRERLELFVPTCRAIQHAHQKGIAHRDLKPANILVTMIDGKPVPKVIDFGVAKATGGKLTNQTLNTQFGAVVGTLEYMSPEQAGFSGVDVDTRTDIYSLGVILYELLTGLRPIDSQRLKNAAFGEMIRIIQEEEPARPSTRVSSHESLPSFAATRQTDPKKLMSLLKGELDWIVLKCLEKSRDRRYETANGLAREIQRYLDDEPVEARPPSAGYRMGKFLRRNKAPAIAVALVALALLAGIAGTTWGLIEARKQEKLANENAEGERRVRIEEGKAKVRAETRAQQLEKGNEIVNGIFADLDIRSVRENEEPVEAVIAERLIKAGQQLKGETVGDPIVVSLLQYRLGQSIRNLGFADQSLELFERSFETREKLLGLQHEDTLLSMAGIASAHSHAGNHDEATDLHRNVWQQQIELLGESHESTLATMGRLGLSLRNNGELKQAVKILEKCVELCQSELGFESSETLDAMNSLALSYSEAGDTERAISIHKQVLDIRGKASNTDRVGKLMSMNNLAWAYEQAGKNGLALPLLQSVVDIARKELGRNHPYQITYHENLVRVLERMGQYQKSIPYREELVELKSSRFGSSGRETMSEKKDLALAHFHSGNNIFAISITEKLLAVQKEQLESDDPLLLLTQNAMGLAKTNAGQYEEAISLFEDALAELRDENPSSVDSIKLSLMNNLAIAYEDSGDSNRAKSLYRETLQIRTTLDPSHIETLRCKNNLAMFYKSIKEFDNAIALSTEVVAEYHTVLGPNHPDTIRSELALGTVLSNALQYDKAIEVLSAAIARAKDVVELDDFLHWKCMHVLATAYGRKSRYDKSADIYKELLELQTPKYGRGSKETRRTLRGLAISYCRDGKPEFAVPAYKELVELTLDAQGTDAEETIAAQSGLCVALAMCNRHHRAKSEYAKLIQKLERLYLEDSKQVIEGRRIYAGLCLRVGDLETAKEHLDINLENSRRTLGASHSNTVGCLRMMAEFNYLDGNYELAIAQAEEALDLAKSMREPRLTMETMKSIKGMSLRELSRHDEAVATFQSLLEYNKEQSRLESDSYFGCQSELVLTYVAMKKLDKAENRARSYLKEVKALPAENWRAFDALSLLGRVQLLQKKHDEAYAELVPAYEGLKRSRSGIIYRLQPRLTNSLKALVEIAKHKELPEDVQKWQRELKRLENEQ